MLNNALNILLTHFLLINFNSFWENSYAQVKIPNLYVHLIIANLHQKTIFETLQNISSLIHT